MMPESDPRQLKFGEGFGANGASRVLLTGREQIESKKEVKK